MRRGKWIGQQPVEHTARLRPAVDIITERDRQRIGTMHFDIALNRSDCALEQIKPTMNIADGIEPCVLVWNCRVLHYD